ncbi:MAG TPA: hypothetical protein HA262_18100 [Methanosarcina sp.]|jgi:hypothetical protein|nr:hypothetical protein [Methanosarcina sp.]
MKYGPILVAVLALILSVYFAPGVIISGAVSSSSTSPFGCSLEVPMDKNQASNVLVAGQTWERARVNIQNLESEPLHNVTVLIEVPQDLEIKASSQLYSITKEGQNLKAEIGDLSPGQGAGLFLDVKPPASIKFKKEVPLKIHMVCPGGEQQSEQTISIVPPPSWLTYFTILASLLLFAGILVAVKHFGVLELFSTVDLITIALLAAIIAVVFRYISKLINLGWFDGLVIAIPTVILMVVALQLVRKPGTATLLFACVLLISVVVWGSQIMWLGFYLAEGVVVDLLVFLFGMDYADRRLTAAVYGISRGMVSTLVFYMLYAPVEWKISYAPWYIGVQLALACAGGLIGGLLGYDTAVKMSGARL